MYVIVYGPVVFTEQNLLCDTAIYDCIIDSSHCPLKYNCPSAMNLNAIRMPKFTCVDIYTKAMWGAICMHAMDP